MKIYYIDDYRIHVNKKKHPEKSLGSVFTIYKNGTRGTIDSGVLEYEHEKEIPNILKRVLEKW